MKATNSTFLGKTIRGAGKTSQILGQCRDSLNSPYRGNSGGPHPNELGLQQKPIAMAGNSGLILDLCWVPKSSSLSFQRNIFTRNDCKKHWFRRFKQSFKNSPMSAQNKPCIEYYLPKKGCLKENFTINKNFQILAKKSQKNLSCFS